MLTFPSQPVEVVKQPLQHALLQPTPLGILRLDDSRKLGRVTHQNELGCAQTQWDEYVKLAALGSLQTTDTIAGFKRQT